MPNAPAAASPVAPAAVTIHNVLRMRRFLRFGWTDFPRDEPASARPLTPTPLHQGERGRGEGARGRDLPLDVRQLVHSWGKIGSHLEPLPIIPIDEASRVVDCLEFEKGNGVGSPVGCVLRTLLGKKDVMELCGSCTYR